MKSGKSLLAAALAAVMLCACAPRLTTTPVGDCPDRYDFAISSGKSVMDGIALAKKVEDGGVRVVGMSRFGMTLFDVTIYEKSYVMHSCADFIDRKMIHAFIANNLRKQLYDSVRVSR